MDIRFKYFIFIFFALTACATPKKNRMALTSAAFVAGAAIGSATAPTDERRELHAMYWGGILGLTAALIGNYLYDEEDALINSRLENEKLRAELDLVQSSNTVLLKEGKGYFKNPAGEEYFQNGKARWRLYQIDRWLKDGPNKLYHQDRAVELLPMPSSE